MSKVGNNILKLLIILYAIYDVFSSASSGNFNEQRIFVHIFLFAILSVMAVTVLVNRYLRFDSITLILILYSYYFAVDVFFIKDNPSWSSIVYFALSLWWLFTIIYFRGKRGDPFSLYKEFHVFFRIMFVFYICAVFYAAGNIVATNSNISYARVGYIYHVLGLLPLIFLDQNRKIKNVFIILTFIVTVFSFKRGAIMVLPFVFLVYAFVGNQTGYEKNNIVRLLLALIAFALVWYFIDKYSNGYLSSRFTLSEISDGSGRANINSLAIENISKRDFLQFVFGISSSNEIPLGVGIHNEWLNQLSNYGLIGTLLYGTLIIQLIKEAIRYLRNKSILAASYCSMVVYTLGIGMVSGWYFMHSTFYIMIYLGFVSSFKTLSEVEIKQSLNHW